MPGGRRYRLMSTCASVALLVAACADGGGGSSVTNIPTDTESEDTDAVTQDALPPDPQPIEFQAADGQALNGLYYPAAMDSAPVVVLMHWANGDLSDWYEVAPWLQNRGLTNPFPNPGTEPWWDPSWFPSVPDDLSVGVFIFSFRGCSPFPAGCQQGGPAEWLLDAQAAVAYAAMLPGVDPSRIAAMGSSIGADGAIDGCGFVNEESPGTCDGALSLSPGSFLGVPYPDAVADLGATNPPVPAWCLADPNEFFICTDVGSAANPEFQPIEITNGQHGNFLMVPPADPSTMQTMLDFLRTINFH